MFNNIQNRYSILGFLSFLKRNRFAVYVMFFFLLLGYGVKLFSLTFSIDTEAIISITPSQYDAWHSLGRTGLVLFKHLIGVDWYNNGLASFLMVCSLGLSALLYGYLLIGNKRDYILLLFFIPIVTSPILAEMLGFLLMGAEVAISLSFIAISLMIIHNYYYFYNKFYILIFAAFLTFVSFSMYLAMTTIFALSVAFVFFLKIEKDLTITKNNWNFLFVHIFVFVLSYATYVIFRKSLMLY